MVDEATYTPKNMINSAINPRAVEKMICARVTGGTLARGLAPPLIL